MIHVEVTQDDIDSGIHSDEFNCPVALAIKRATGCDARVFGRAVTLYKGNDALLPAKPPEAVEMFIRDFDYYQRVAPFGFDLDVDLPQ